MGVSFVIGVVMRMDLDIPSEKSMASGHRPSIAAFDPPVMVVWGPLKFCS
jgi:hypothetical protein